MTTLYYAHGKLLLTAEYLILDGAKAIALPTKKGQRMVVAKHTDDDLYWKSYNHQGQLWLDGVWDIAQMKWITINDSSKASYIQTLLQYASSELGIELSGYTISTYLEFPNEWGLGSSSTLISLLSQWWKVDPYDLLQHSFKGSGYDIACACASGPILYQIAHQKPSVEEIDFSPSFKDQIGFLFLGKKQNSRQGIQLYRSLDIDKEKWVAKINLITTSLLNCDDFKEFEQLLEQHEDIISAILHLEKVKDKFFSDYQGVVKSLGAWGGDFVLVTHNGDIQATKSYFSKLGFSSFLTYDEMIL